MKAFYFCWIILVIGIILPSNIIAQEAKTITLNDSENNFKIIASDKNTLVFENTISTLTFKDIRIKTNFYVKLDIENYGKSNKIGDPELPVLNKLIQIPIGAKIKIKNLTYNTEYIDLTDYGFDNKIQPKQIQAAKSEDQENVAFSINQQIYNTNQFTNTDKVTVEILGIKRGQRLARVSINTIDYNPVKNSLKVYTEIKAEIEFVQADIAKTSELQKKTQSSIYSASNKVINQKDFNTVQSDQKPISMVVLSDPIFKDSLQTYINWKKKKGFEIIELYMGNDTVGTTPEEMKACLKDLYENATAEKPAPTFGLIVGDHGNIPAFEGTTGDHITDLYYFEYTDDIFPELYYGRFPANNNEELMNIISKTIEYEMYTMETFSFLDQATLVAGVDVSYGPYFANSHVNYSSTYYFNEAHGYNTNKYLHPSSGANAAQIIETVNNGLGFLKYSGHCLYTGWRDPQFLYSDVYNLTNNGMYPTVIGNCCESVRFEKPSSFGEVWLRAPDKGAIGYIGASNLSYWLEDFYFDNGFGNISATPSYESTTVGAMDLLFHDHGEPEQSWALTNSQILSAGNMAVTEAGTDKVNYYWEVYHLMGDPSLMTYLSVPDEMTVSHNSEIITGIEKLTIEAEESAYVAVSINNELIDAKHCDSSGKIDFKIPYSENDQVIDIVATKQNKIPYFGTIQTVSSNQPVLTFINHQEKNADGTIDTLLTFGESVNIDITIRNIGLSDANSLSFELNSSSNLISITDNIEFIDQIESRSIIDLIDIFQFEIKSSILGTQIVPFTIKINDDNEHEWELNFESVINGPEFILKNIIIDDTDGGNSNYHINRGEAVSIGFDIINTGKVKSNEMNSSLTPTHFGHSVFNNYQLPELLTDSAFHMEYTIGVDQNLLSGSPIKLNLALENSTHYFDTMLQFATGILIEDFENEDFTSYEWNTEHFNTWQIYQNSTEENVYSNEFAMRSAVIGDNDTSAISITLNVMENDSVSFYKKVSCEKGSLLNYADYFEFKIDTTSMGKWRDQIDWSYESFPVEKGLHTFTWLYVKNNQNADYDDCVWVDLVRLPMDSSIYHNSAPEFTSSPIAECYINETYSYNIDIFDADNDNVSIKYSGLSSWLDFEFSTNNQGLLSGTPLAENTGTEIIQLTAFDGKSYSNQIFELEIINPNSNEQNLIKSEIEIYPNPNNGEFDISLTNDQSDFDIFIYDSNGKQIINKHSLQGYSTIKLKTKGCYFVKIISSNQTIVKPIIVY